MMADELWWEIDGKTVLLPRDQWPYQPRRLGIITSIPAEANAMTEDELLAIEARANAATPGPWEVEQKGCTVLRAPNGPPADQSLMGDEQYYPWTPDRIEDWQFIASARTDVPALVAEVRRLRGPHSSGELPANLSGCDHVAISECTPASNEQLAIRAEAKTDMKP
jgi:hypothetical protein